MAVFTPGSALVIGAGGDLPATIADATGLASLLADPARCAYAPEQVRLLTDAQATRPAVLAALEALTGAATTATVVIYFSGHGYRLSAAAGPAYYLLPYGYDLNRLAQTAISGMELADRLRAIPAARLLVLLDCCHAGGVGEAKSGAPLTRAALPLEAQQWLAEGRGRVLIASSREDELSYAGRPYSAFTLALLEALCGVGAAKADGYVRVADLALHAREAVPGRTQGRQHPILHFEQADNFVLAYYAGGESQPKGVPWTVVPEIEPEPGAWRGWGAGGMVQAAQGSGNIQLQIGNLSGGAVNLGGGAGTAAPPGLTCPACGRPLRPGARFCGQCGRPVAA